MEGKVVFITGAASGIGQACAVGYARQGAKLALTDRNNLDATVQKCTDAGLNQQNIFCTTGDLTADDDVQAIVDASIQHYGRVDILLNVAGVTFVGGILDTPVEEMDRLYKVHMRAPFLLSQKLVPHLIKTKGNIVNVSSTCAQSPIFSCISYCSAKAGLDHFTRCLALELSSHGVRVNSVNPTATVTPFLFGFFGAATQDEKDKVIASMGREHPFGRCASVEDVVEAVMFLADSSKSGVITGVNLCVDAGWMLKSGALQTSP